MGRFLSLLLFAGGWELLKRQTGSWPLDKLPTGLGRHSPVSLGLFGAGLFSLLGLPFTLGFAAQWRLLTAVAEMASRNDVPWWLPAVALLALGFGAAGVLRIVAALLAKNENEDEVETAVSADPLWLQVSVGLLLVLAVWLALFPPPFLNPVLAG